MPVPVIPVPGPLLSTVGISLLSPTDGMSVSGFLPVVGQVNVSLDAAGSYLMVDGVEVGTRRVTAPPFLYGLDTTALSNGPHALQLWAHDIGNNTVVSAPITIVVGN